MKNSGKTIVFMSVLLVFLIRSGTSAEINTENVFKPYSQILGKYLVEMETDSGGLVSAYRYREAHADDEIPELLDKQKKLLRHFDTSSLKDKSSAVSFWINAYNFFMLAYILENPLQNGEWIKSVKDYGNWFDPYRIFKKELFEIGDETYSLDRIEKEILLGEKYRKLGWKDARVHFAVNCASVGCPPLRSGIYKPGELDNTLSENTRLALKTRRHMHITGTTLNLTRLFDWYDDDFIEGAGSVIGYIKQYAPEDTYEAINHTGSVRYIEYDWSLNEPRNFPEFR